MFEPCPCGSGATYLACCGRLHAGQADAPDPEALMRSRYSAFVRLDAPYLLRTWAPETRPARLDLSDGREWLGLKVEPAALQGPDAATVRFTARYRLDGRPGRLRERSRFRREQGRWLYVDGDLS